MSKTCHDDFLDAALNHLKNNAKQLSCCAVQPTTYTEAVATNKLSLTTISGADFTGPVDDTSGRKVTVGQKIDVPVSTTGSAQIFALCTSAGAAKLLYTTDVSGTIQTITDGGTMTFNTWVVNIEDPV